VTGRAEKNLSSTFRRFTFALACPYLVTSILASGADGKRVALYMDSQFKKESLLMQYAASAAPDGMSVKLATACGDSPAGTGSDDAESLRRPAARRRSRLQFLFDTAWAYGEGRSEQILGKVMRANAARNSTSQRKFRQES